jgi:4-amino-4-deoxy-L-arabinose transferase-like glycosyltransferase
MGRRMFSARVGLIAAIFMAAWPFHIQFSRTGMDQTGDPCFAALTFAFLTIALRDDDAMEASLAGLCLGLTQYFYFAGKIVPLLVVVYVCLYALRGWRLLWQRRGVLLITFVVACVVVFPYQYTAFRDNSRSLNPRLSHVGIWETGDVQAAADQDRLGEYWQNQIYRSVMAYVQIHDESDIWGRYNAVLGWFAPIPFLVGLGLLLRRLRDPRFALLLVWILGTATLGGAMLVDPPHYPRYVSAAPALALIVGLGISWISVVLKGVLETPRLTRRFGERGTLRWGRVVPIGLALVLASADMGTYVLDYLPQTDTLLYGVRTRRLNQLVEVVDALDDRYEIWYFSSAELPMGITDLTKYLLYDRGAQEYSWEIERWREVLPSGDYVFFIAPDRFDEVGGRLVYEIVGGELRVYFDKYSDKPMVYAYFVGIG